MGLTSAMLIGFTGIKTNQYAIDAIGNNVANLNTTGFKNQRALFETTFYHTIRGATAPSEETGGTNPAEVGHGSQLATLQRNFAQGALDATGMASDLAIQGQGMFILAKPDGTQVYTRDGSFALDADRVLVSSDGSFVRGFGADESGTIDDTVLSNLQIPLGQTMSARATNSVTMDGNLDAASQVASTAGVSTTSALQTAAGPATEATVLTDLVDEDGVALFADGDVVAVSGAEQGGIELPDSTFTVGADGSTVGDFASFLEQALLINTDPATGGTPGVTVSDGTTAPAGALVITSNLGEANAVSLDGTDIRNSTTGVLPLSFTSTPAVGEGVTTAFNVIDSLGNSVGVRLRAALESRDDTGSVWRFYAESADDTSGGILGTGTISFDQNGQLLGATGTDLSIALSGSGAVSPLTFSLDLSKVTSLNRADGESVLVMDSQDGRAPGTLIGYSVGKDGVITGTYDNDVEQVFGQVALATFTNPEGLVGLEDNTFAESANSGQAVVVAPQTLGAGRLEAGQLEQSNVDLPREFIGLITASTGFSAAGRVVRTADELLQELLLLVR
jgi:flagellar hook protein FlgE